MNYCTVHCIPERHAVAVALIDDFNHEDNEKSN